MKIEHISPNDIEKRSFEIIESELCKMGIEIPEDKGHIIKRCIHTTADFEYSKSLYFSESAIDRFEELLSQEAVIVTDTNMALSGINKKALSKYNLTAKCFMADEEVARIAKERNVTRATVSMEIAASLDKPVVFVIGNAPTALISLRQMYDEGSFKPAFVIGVPVGFVNVVAAKELIMETDIPCIINVGRKGGSNVAAAIVNALLYGRNRFE